MEPCRLVFPNFRRYHTWDESLGGVWTNLGRAPFQIGYIEQNDKPSGWAKPRRLLELFKNPDSTKWKVDALLNTGTRSNFVTAIIQLKEARSINAQPESVKIVKGKAKNISKGSSQWNSNHCNKACYESEAWLKSLVADQSTAYTGKRTIHAAYKGGGDNSKRHGKASKAIGFHSGYTGRSIAWLFTANGKGSDKCYCAIYRITWSWDSLSGRVCCSIESYEEGKTVWDVAILSCEGELVSDLYGQAQGVHLTEERRTIETFTGVEQQESNGLSPYAHIGGSMRLGPDDHSTIWFDFIQATSDAVLPDEFSTNPLEVVSPIFFEPNYWFGVANFLPWSLLLERSIYTCGNV
jgi:hypothetical protein